MEAEPDEPIEVDERMGVAADEPMEADERMGVAADELMEAEPDEFDFYGLENISAGMELDLLLPEQEKVELELDRIKIVFWVEGHKISAECFDLSKVSMNNYLTAIKWIDTKNLFEIFLEVAGESVLAKKVKEQVESEQVESVDSFNKGLESALRFYLELKYLIANIEIKQKKNMLRCKAYKRILMDPMLLKHYNNFCVLIDVNSKKKLVGGQRLNSFILYLVDIYNKNLDSELVPLFEKNTEIRLLFQQILMLGHSDLDWNEKPIHKEDELATQLFKTVMHTLKDFLDDDERVEYVDGEEWEKTVYDFCSSKVSLDDTNKNLETINFDNIKSYTLTSDKVQKFEQILEHPLIFQLSEEADLKKIGDALSLEEKNLFKEKIHIPQQQKKKLTRIFTSLVSASLLHMHMHEHNINFDNYFKMLGLLTKNDFKSDKCKYYLQLLIKNLTPLLPLFVKETKLQGQKIPEKIRRITAQQYENGQLKLGKVGKQYYLPYAATPTKNRITLPIVSSELYAEEVVDPMSQHSLGSPSDFTDLVNFNTQ